MASRSVLVLDILHSSEMSAHVFLLFARVQRGLGQGSQEPGVTLAPAVPAPTISIPWGLTMEEFNLPLMAQRHRESFKLVSIFLCFPHSPEGTGCAEGPWHTATRAASLTQHKMHSALPRLALGTPQHSPATCSCRTGFFSLPFLAEHTPQESSPAWPAAALGHTPRKVSSSKASTCSFHAGHHRSSALLSPGLVVSQLMSLPGERYSQRSASQLLGLI